MTTEITPLEALAKNDMANYWRACAIEYKNKHDLSNAQLADLMNYANRQYVDVLLQTDTTKTQTQPSIDRAVAFLKYVCKKPESEIVHYENERKNEKLGNLKTIYLEKETTGLTKPVSETVTRHLNPYRALTYLHSVDKLHHNDVKKLKGNTYKSFIQLAVDGVIKNDGEYFYPLSKGFITTNSGNTNFVESVVREGVLKHDFKKSKLGIKHHSLPVTAEKEKYYRKKFSDFFQSIINEAEADINKDGKLEEVVVISMIQLFTADTIMPNDGDKNE